MSTNQYQEMRNRQQAEINAFPMFFAFNKQQFAEGMRTLGLSLSDTCQMCSIFGGGYCRKSDAAKLDEMLARHRKELEDAISSDKTGKGFIFDMFLQELENHEYSYTGDVQEALDALGITPQYMEATVRIWTCSTAAGRLLRNTPPPYLSWHCPSQGGSSMIWSPISVSLPSLLSHQNSRLPNCCAQRKLAKSGKNILPG